VSTCGGYGPLATLPNVSDEVVGPSAPRNSHNGIKKNIVKNLMNGVVYSRTLGL
jgi:hypothetical protein